MLKKTKLERQLWIDIMLTLLALELMSYFYYGVRALVLGGMCIGISFVTELISLRLMKRHFTADDLTCTSDALLIALMLPASFEYLPAAVACVFAVSVAKNIFGGRHNMLFSPAAAAYTFLITSWGREMLLYPAPHDKIGILGTADELVTSASHYYNLSGKMNCTDFELIMGNISGPQGAVNVLLVAVAAAVLLLRGSISSGAFTGVISGTCLLAYVTPSAYSVSESVRYSLVNNMVLFAAVYIVSDKRIAPRKNIYAFFYGLFIGVVSYIIVLTTARENAIIMVSVLFTPAALFLRNVEDAIDKQLLQEPQPETVPEAAAEVIDEKADTEAESGSDPVSEAVSAAEELLKELTSEDTSDIVSSGSETDSDNKVVMSEEISILSGSDFDYAADETSLYTGGHPEDKEGEYE